MRKGAVAACIALVSVWVVPQAHATAGTVAGWGNVTAFQNCPEQFKIPIDGTQVDGEWVFTIAGAHVSCVITWGNPLPFRGQWNPAAPACDALTGVGCPRSLDPLRPGFFALGAVPLQGALTVTTLRFCVLAKCWSGNAVVERV